MANIDTVTTITPVKPITIVTRFPYKQYFFKALAVTLFFSLLYLVLLYKLYFFTNAPYDFFLEIYSLLTGLFLISRLFISYFYSDDHTEVIPASQYPSVSFVIACKNEEDSIYKTISTCLSSEYPGQMECIAVNDGSTDNTLFEMKRAAKRFGKSLKIISFPQNRGKREGMAEGVLKARGEIILFVDSDSFVRKDGAKLLVEHFIRNPKVGAVSGNSLVENSDVNLLTRMQAARYGISYNIFKTSESVFGTVTCCPGCFSGYRRSAVLEVLDSWRNQQFLGTRSTFGDDRSLTNHVMRHHQVVYCQHALASTIVPTKYKTFFRQQLRWKKSWIREGTNAASFIWRKHPIAALSFYINLLIPVFGPFIVIRTLVYDGLIRGYTPFFFIGGTVVMSLLFGVYYYLILPNRYWWYVVFFSLLYTFVLIWQMPYALLKLRDTSWGTR